MTANSVVRIAFAAFWVFSPPFLAVLALLQWKRQRAKMQPISHWPLVLIAAVLFDWLLFATLLAMGQIGGFGSHYMTTRLADILLVGSLVLLIGSLVVRVGRWQLSVASLLVLALWLGSELVA